MTKKIIWPVIDEVETEEDDTEFDNVTLDIGKWPTVTNQVMTFANTPNNVSVGYVNQQIETDQNIVSDAKSTTFTGDLVLRNKDGKELDIGATIETMQERFLILQADFEAHEEYPALKDAYDQYKMLEKLLKGGKNVKED